MKQILGTLALFLLAQSFVHAQPAGFTKEVVDLINQARTSPEDFLKQYKEKVEKCSPQFVKILEEAEPIPKVIWDEGLAAMQKDAVENDNLNPSYPGTMDGFRLSSGGSGAGYGSMEAISLLCEFYTVINDPAETHFGLYYNRGDYSFRWGASLSINSNKAYTYSKKPDLSKVDFAKLNTAKNETYMSDFEREMIKELNFVRMYPAIYADVVGQHMQEHSESWDGLDKDEYFATNELIEELKNAEPFGLLEPKECVYRAAEKHGEDCKKRGFIDHTGSDDSDPWDRIKKYCDGASGNENIVGTSDYDVRKAVIALLVDSGIASRGHRYNMLNKDWKYAGCYHYVDEDSEWSAYFTIGYCIQNFSK